MKMHLANPDHEVAYQDLCQLVNKHAGKLTALELLAVAANMVGKIVAMQDQRTTTLEMAMEVVSANIEQGNRSVFEQLANSRGGTA